MRVFRRTTRPFRNLCLGILTRADRILLQGPALLPESESGYKFGIGISVKTQELESELRVESEF